LMIKFCSQSFESVKSIEFFSSACHVALLVTNAQLKNSYARSTIMIESTVGHVAAGLVFAAGLLPPDRRLSRPVDRLCQTYYSTNVLK